MLRHRTAPGHGVPPEGTDGAALLEQMRTERGYTLSYHEIYARIEPGFLAAYANLYRACTLTPRSMPARSRELVWVALLNSIRERVGSIHLDRAREAGVAPEELASAIRLAGVAESWEPLAFADRHWSSYLPEDAPTAYLDLVEAARGPLEAPLADLILMVAQAARQRDVPFVLHLKRCYQHELPEEQIAEALSYILQPVGANQLLWATDLWLDALRDGDLPPSPLLGRGDFDTRTS